jgi:hypothetical protein
MSEDKYDFLLEYLKDIKGDIKDVKSDITKLKTHFDERHDNNIKIINKNKEDIAVLKFKQYVIAGFVGLGGGIAQDVLKKIIF